MCYNKYRKLREVIKMIKANEARAKVREIEQAEKLAIKERAIQFCETEINEKIKLKVAEKGTQLIVKCDPIIKENAWAYLKEQGFVVYYTGVDNLDIRWDKAN